MKRLFAIGLSALMLGVIATHADDAEAKATDDRYIGSPISVDFQNISVRDALQIIEEEAGINFVISDSVTGDLTLRLKEVPWDQALETIMQIKGLAKREKNNVIWIVPAEEITAEERVADDETASNAVPKTDSQVKTTTKAQVTSSEVADAPKGEGYWSYNAESYVGDRKDGVPHGKGRFTWKDGSWYEGDVKDGRIDGSGTMNFPKGVRYVGEFRQGNLHGQGVITDPDGFKYEGEFKDDRPHGRGVLTVNNKYVYTGEFKDGVKHGRGKRREIDLEGVEAVGTWKNDQLWEGEVLKDGELWAKWSEGEEVETESNGSSSTTDRNEVECRRVFDNPNKWARRDSDNSEWEPYCWEFVEKQGGTWKWVGSKELRKKEEERQAKAQREEEEKRKIAEKERTRLENEKKAQQEEEDSKRANSEERLAYINENLKTVSLEELEQFLVDYQPLLGSEPTNLALTEYVERFRDTDSKETGDVIKSLMNLYRKSRQLGIKLDQVSNTGVYTVVLSDTETTDKHDFALNLGKQDAPSFFNPTVTTFQQAIKTEVGKNADILIIVDIASAAMDRDITDQQEVQSEYEFSTRRIPNPEYDKARIDAETFCSLADYISNTAESRCSRPTSTSSIVAFSQIRLCSQGRMRALLARTECWDKRETLKNIPSTILESVYDSYSFQKSAIRINKKALINVYVVDRRNNTIVMVPHTFEDEKRYSLIFGLHQKDKNYANYKTQMTPDSEILGYEESALERNILDLFDSFSINNEGAESLLDLSAVAEHILSSKSEPSTQEQEPDKEIVTAQGIPFNSVVIVLHPDGGIGSGFYVSEDTILTNYHVTSGTSYLELALFSGEETFGKVIAKDIRLDLALVKVQARGTPLTLYRESSLPVGGDVLAVGHPAGLEFSITKGTISGIRRLPSKYDPGGKAVRFIQTDVAINPGNSGGPLLFGKKVVGVNTQKLVSQEIEGLSFAVHYTEVIRFLEKNGVK